MRRADAVIIAICRGSCAMVCWNRKEKDGEGPSRAVTDKGPASVAGTGSLTTVPSLTSLDAGRVLDSL